MIKNSKFASSARTKAALIALAACVASPAAMAAVQCSTTTPINLTSTSDIYINLVTGSTSGAAGWDINPYPSTSGFAIYWDGTSTLNAGVADTTTGPFTVLSSGAVIGPTSTFAATGNGAAGMFPFYVPVGQTNKYLGVKFTNETQPGSPINYGWVSLTTTGAAAAVSGAGFPVTINEWCYEDNGTEITAGTTPVSLQSYSID